MKKTLLIIILLVLANPYCTDTIENSMYDKDLEKGQWDNTAWQKSKWQ